MHSDEAFSIGQNYLWYNMLYVCHHVCVRVHAHACVCIFCECVLAGVGVHNSMVPRHHPH